MTISGLSGLDSVLLSYYQAQQNASPSAIAAANAVALQSVLDGKPGPFRDVALLIAAVTLIVAGYAKNLEA